MEKIKNNNEFELHVSEPVLVGQGREYIEGWAGWGYFQFPKIYRRIDGVLYASCTPNDAQDHGLSFEKKPCEFISTDNGKTWQEAEENLINQVSVADPVMSNGKVFVGFETKNSYIAEWLQNYEPVSKTEYIQHNQDGDVEGIQAVYLADDVKEYEKGLFAKEYNPKTGKVSTFYSTVNWENMPIWYSEEMAISLGGLFALQNKMGITQLDDGSLIFVAYAVVTKEEYKMKSGLYVFHSTDNARTWNLISTVFPDVDGELGYTEPFVHKMPDGSFIIVFRTGYKTPSFITRSTDECKTWSKPKYFDRRLGVFPQVVTLDCGVTIASYGRPGIFVKATADERGIDWQEPVDVNIPVTCSYTGIVAIAENKALLVYSDFVYPRKDDPTKTAKSILLKEITVVKK